MSRREAWRRAAVATHYWRTLRDWRWALKAAQEHDVADSNSVAEVQAGEDLQLVQRWREAIVAQMLTPAADTAAVGWKRAQLRAGQWRYLADPDADKRERRLQAAIDRDVEWLAVHPTRRPIAQKKPKTSG